MKTELKTYTIEQITDGFVYSELENKGLYGLGGELVIQPEFQRNYIYAKDNKDKKVIDSLLKGYPIGLIYFSNGLDDEGNERLEVLDGQQRITSIGRFITGKFAVMFEGREHTFNSLPQDKKDFIKNYKILVYVCKGTESEIKEWFKTINTEGVPLNEQELRNAIYSGSFVTLAKQEFSNSGDARREKWATYIWGDINRQEILQEALKWVGIKKDKTIDAYMSEHRQDDNIDELTKNSTTIIDWVSSTFPGETYKEMRGREWGRLHKDYGQNSYNPKNNEKRIKELMDDENVTDKKEIFEYILSGEKNKKLLNIRIFDEKIAKQAYNRQTKKAEELGVSNCPLCANGDTTRATKIFKFKEMDVDHATAWSKGGDSSLGNCQMLCKPCNRSKGNR